MGRKSVYIEPSKKNYDKLIKYYASRNILLERGVLEKEDLEKENFGLSVKRKDLQKISKSQ